MQHHVHGAGDGGRKKKAKKKRKEEKEQEEGGHWQHAVKVEHIERLHEQP